MVGLLTVLERESRTGQVLLAVRGVSKTFPGLRALDDVSVELRSGEVLALVGQNGSGKSTLVKVLAGLHDPDPGSIIEVRGPDGEMLTGRRASEELHFIHQDLGLVPALTTVENIDLGRRMRGGGVLPVNRRLERREVAELIGRFGGEFDVAAPVSRLTVAERTIVAIARAMDGWSRPDNVLVLDEPTAALHGDEATKLAGAVRLVAEAGAGIIFISHRLDEVLDLADRIVVLRDGSVVADQAADGIDARALARMIVGRQLDETERVARVDGTRDPALTVSSLTGGAVRDVSFTLSAGEVVGVSGLLGSGREQLCGLLFGAEPRAAGEIRVGDGTSLGESVSSSIANGMGFVPADRLRLGAALKMSVKENLTLSELRSLRTPWGAIDRDGEEQEARHWVDQVELRPRSTSRLLGTLSGGNQQKVVLARWLRTDPKVLLLDEPTQGVDVGAKASIYRLLGEAAARGCAVLLSSSDTAELVALCRRVLVFRDGALVSDLRGDDLDEETLLAAAMQPSSPLQPSSHRDSEPR